MCRKNCHQMWAAIRRVFQAPNSTKRTLLPVTGRIN